MNNSPTQPLILDGKALSATIRQELRERLNPYKAQGQRLPHLAAVLVGNNPASMAYVRNKIKACEDAGFRSSLLRLPETCSQAELLALIAQLNAETDLDGYIVQLPLPKHIDEAAITLAIDPTKDVDGFHPYNMGLMTLGQPSFLPATPYGILLLLERYGIPTEGKQVVIVGRSNIVGRPLSILLSRATSPGNATVTLAHSRSRDLPALCQQADILVAAIGKAEFIGTEHLKPGAVVIDVGINSVEEASDKGYRLVGDVNYAQALPLVSAITPVPGGVGPMTIAALLMNTFQAYQQRLG